MTFLVSKGKRASSLPTSCHDMKEFPGSWAPRMPSEDNNFRRPSSASDVILQTQDEFKHVYSIPGTPVSIEQEHDTPQIEQGAAASKPTHEVSHSPFKDVHKGMWKSQKLPTKRCLETIVDNIPPSALAKRMEQMSSRSPQRSRQQPTTAPSETKFKQLPPNAPRDIEKLGRYTFRKGVRIRDYHVPAARLRPPVPSSVQFQCRDGFDGHETFVSGFSRPMTKRPRDPQWREEQGLSSPFPMLPLTPRSTTPVTQSRRMSDALGNTEQVARLQEDPQSFQRDGEGHEAFKQ